MRPVRVVVSGDIVVDHHLYEGNRRAPGQAQRRGVRHVRQNGGAAGVLDLIRALGALDHGEGRRRLAPELGIVEPEPTGPSSVHHAFAVWKPFPRERGDEDAPLVWRVDSKMGYGQEPIPPDPQARWEPVATNLRDDADVLVLDDAGFAIRHSQFERCWHLDRLAAGGWVVLKLSAPIADGDLWRALAAPSRSAWLLDRTVVVVAAEDLRREAVQLHAGASWERTLQDLAAALDRPELSALKRCAHLVVTFSGDGAVWLQPGSKGPATLCFRTDAAEGDFAAGLDGEAVGYMTAMTAAIAYGVAQAETTALDLAPWLGAGLSGMRDLLREGHGRVPDAGATAEAGFPVQRIAGVILQAAREVTAGRASPPSEAERRGAPLAMRTVPWPPSGERDSWSLVEATEWPPGGGTQRNLFGLAAAVVRKGLTAYETLPHLRFGAFVTAERREIEMLRAINSQMRAYKATARTGEKPLSIGVFGPPGAGKSFAVREIAREVFGERAWMEFNLSQFNDAQDLAGALHQVRDKVLEGLTPVAFWDEFDSRKLTWLQYLLAPLQDGKFQAGPLTHWVGRSVFVFAGGTAHSRKQFGKPSLGMTEEALRQLKAPDFESRLDVHYDVSGPNPRLLRTTDATKGPALPDPDDVGFALRRALQIRSVLRMGARESLEIDPDVLRALLAVPRYEHGARSLEKLVRSLAPSKRRSLRISDLPPPVQLGMHVDAGAFMKLVADGQAFSASDAPERIAPGIHDAYRTFEDSKGRTPSARFNRPYLDLDAAARHDNIAAARRFPAVLALAGLAVAREDDAADRDIEAAAVATLLETHLERLAEAEHDGWVEARRRNGWSFGADRNDAWHQHPLMMPYDALPAAAKERDRHMVRGIPARLAKSGWRIVRL